VYPSCDGGLRHGPARSRNVAGPSRSSKSRLDPEGADESGPISFPLVLPVFVQPRAIFMVGLLDVIGEPVTEEVQQMQVQRNLSTIEAR